MKPVSPSRKAGTLILSSLILATAALVVGLLIQRSKPAVPQAVARSGKAGESVAIPRTRPASQDAAVAAAEQDATANAQPCDNTVLTNLDLSRPPTEAELIAAGNLGEKLTPTRSADPQLLTDPAARKHQELDNLTFGTAIQAWNDHRYDEALRLFTEHLQSFPDSPWAAESMLHIGCHHQYVARFSESVEWFDKILETAPVTSEMYHKAKLRRSILNVDLGRLDEATKGFSEMMRSDPDPNHQSYASYWLIQTELLKKNETALRDCGQKALSQAAKILGDAGQADTLFQLTAAGPHGYTAAELHATALAHGLDSNPVQARGALDVLPVPFIAHYTDRHYVTVESVTGETVRLYDSRIAASTDMPRASFEKSWSGFALLMKPTPANANIHQAENLNEIIGGCCGQPTQVSDLGDDGCNDSCGLPTYSVNPINMNFKVIDTPMWWEAPAGPSVKMKLLFNSQDSLNNFEPFGEKWSFEYVSYLLITPGERVQVKDGDGRLETFPAPIGGIPTPVVYPVTYQSPPGDFRVLRQNALHNFTLTGQDGTIYQYGIPAAIGGGSSVPLLLSITDRHSNTLSITHNANGAVTGISHSSLPTKSWNLVYGTINGIYSRVIRIDDPFSRSCSFSYDNLGRLTGQTDMGGLAYSYTYTTKNLINNNVSYIGQTAVPQLLIDSITTPTGTTTVLTEPADGIDTRSVTYTSEELAMGYLALDGSYPPPGKPMWTNYRITIKDHIEAPTEYYFCGFDSVRYVRNPVQMQRPFGFIRPNQGARTQMETTLVGGKGEINSTVVYGELGNVESSSYTTEYSQTSRRASKVPDGNGGKHYLEYNSQGKPTLIKLNNSSSADQQIDIDYIQPLAVDVDTVTRKIKKSDGTFETKTLTDFSYYSNRDVQSVTDVNGRVISYLWYANGLPQQITDSVTGDVIVFTYDSHSRPHTVSVNGVVVSTTVYDLDGKGTLQSTLAPSGQFASYEYDNLNRLTKELRSDNSFTAYQWACCYIESTRFGKMVGGSEKTLRRTVTLHDPRALPLTTTDSDGGTTSYAYDIAGRFIKLTDPKNQITEWKYNAAGQLKEKIYPDTSKESFTYVPSSWGMGQVKTFTNRRNQTTELVYEYDGQLDFVSKPNGERELLYNYDTWRRISTITQNAGAGMPAEVHTFAHDLLGRVTSIDGPWADDTIGYAYSDAARTVTRTSPGGMSQTISGDAYGRVASIANVLGTFSNIYGGATAPNVGAGVGDPLTDIIHAGANAGFSTAFTYHGDAFDRALESITSTKPGGATVAQHTYAYDTFGNIQTWEREAPLANPSGPTRQFESRVFYDRADQVSSLIHTPLAGSSVAASAHHYVYDAAGNIASKQVETPGADSTMVPYTHNALNQTTAIGGSGGARPMTVRGTTSEPAKVTATTSAAGAPTKNARMLAGNRFEADLDLATGANQIHLQAKDGSGNQANYSYALSLAAAPAAVPTHDADGNMTSDGVRAYAWDSQSRLTKITWGGSPVKSTEYRYNALGQRSEQIEKSGTTETAHYYYLYEGIQFLCRYTGGTAATNIDRQYLAQGEQRKTGSVWASHYYNRDHLGSIREVMNSDGSLAARYDYDPYGKRQTQYLASAYTGGCDLGFTGHITQQSAVSGQGEIVLTLFRAYDPELGRWLSADPIGEAGGMNLYGYIGNGPLNGVDPYGLWVWHVAGAAAGFGLDLAAQLAMNGGDLSNVNWGSTLISAGTGALGVGLGANVAKITGSIAARAALNALGSAAIGAAGQAANNALDDCKSWDKGLGQAALLNGMLGGAGSAVGDKIGRLANAAAARAAWSAASLPQKQFIVGGSITVGNVSGSDIGTGIGNAIGVVLSNSGPLTNISNQNAAGESSGCK